MESLKANHRKEVIKMGLDMYFTKKTYVKNWDHQKPSERHSFLIKKGGKVRKDIDPKKISYITEEVAYWRKANAIHGWFVENCQGGEDDCRDAYVSHEDMQKLLDLVNEVLDASELVKGKVQNGKRMGKNGKWEPIMEDGKFIKDPSVAKELLPVTEGFFFGNYDEETAYDQWYYESLEYTKKVLEEALKNDEGDYYYHSSW